MATYLHGNAGRQGLTTAGCDVLFFLLCLCTYIPDPAGGTAHMPLSQNHWGLQHKGCGSLEMWPPFSGQYTLAVVAPGKGGHCAAGGALSVNPVGQFEAGVALL